MGELSGKWHNVEIFEKMIDSLKLGAAVGPNGLSTEAIKRLKAPIVRKGGVVDVPSGTRNVLIAKLEPGGSGKNLNPPFPDIDIE